MHEEIDYAEILEIPVSTVNVVKKTSRRRKEKNAAFPFPTHTRPLSNNDSFAPDTSASPHAQPMQTLQNPLRDSVIAQVNDRLSDEENAPFLSDYAYENNQTPLEITAEADLFAESANSEGRLDFDPIPERIDTVRLYSEENKRSFWDRFRFRDYDYSVNSKTENSPTMYAENKENEPLNAIKITLNAEFIAACVLCGAIFLTNVFMPHSAINTFFRSMTNAQNAQADTRSYNDFELSPVISDLSKAELNLSPTGVLSFTEEGCVYSAADGVVSAVERSKDGTYMIKISHSDTFTGIIGGLDYVYYAVGDAVKANVPIGYSEGESEVQVTMYSEGVLLNCFELTEENCLAWVEEN